MTKEDGNSRRSFVERISARVKENRITVDQVALAAYLGHRAARELAGEKVDPPDDILEWMTGINTYGQEAVARAAVAVARLVLPEWTNAPPKETFLAEVPFNLICSAEAWILCRTDMNSAHVDETLEGMDEVPELLGSEESQVRHAAIMSLAIGAALATRDGWEEVMGSVHSNAVLLIEPERIRQEIRAGIYPWALGINDPLLDDPTVIPEDTPPS